MVKKKKEEKIFQQYFHLSCIENHSPHYRTGGIFLSW